MCTASAGVMSTRVNSASVFEDAAELESVFGSLLGCGNSCKLIENEGKYQIHKCAFLLLKCIDTENPFRHLLLSTLDAHHKQFCCGTTTLLMLTLWLLQAATELIAQGFCPDDVIDGYHEGFNICIQYLERLKLTSVFENNEKKEKPLLERVPRDVNTAEDDFDDISWYFEDKTEMKPTEAKINTQPVITFDNVLDDLVAKSSETNKEYSSLKSSSDDLDEFDECFNSGQDALDVENSTGNCTMPCTKAEVLKTQLELKIEQIINSSLKGNTPTKSLNRSRHFTTVESTLEELSGKTKTLAPSAQYSEIAVLTDNSVPERTTEDTLLSKNTPDKLNDTDTNKNRRTELQKGKADCCPSNFPSNNAKSVNCVYSNELFLRTFLTQQFNKYPELNGKCIAEKHDFIWKIVCGACHGDESIAHLIMDLFHLQNESPSCKLRFSKELIHFSRACQRSPKWSSVVKGLVVKVSVEQLTILRTEKLHKAVLLNADLTPYFRHKGHTDAITGQRLAVKVSGDSPLQRWIEKSLEILEGHGVTAVLVRDQVLPEFEVQCFAKGIAVVSNVPVKMLLTLAEESNSEVLVYMGDIVMADRLPELTLQPCSCGWMDSTHQNQFVRIQSQNSHFQTVLVSSWNEDLLVMMEESMHHAVQRLHNIVNDEYCLPGSGVTELLCAQQLLQAEKRASHCGGHVILASLATAFQKFFRTIHANNGYQNVNDFSDLFRLAELEECVYVDDFTSKVAAWKGCLCLLKQLLHVDTEIITGLKTDFLSHCV